MPIGGIDGIFSGAMLGDGNGHILGEQMGFKSIALSQTASTLPFTHLQTQAALAIPKPNVKHTITRNIFIVFPFKLNLVATTELAIRYLIS